MRFARLVWMSLYGPFPLAVYDAAYLVHILYI